MSVLFAAPIQESTIGTCKEIIRGIPLQFTEARVAGKEICIRDVSKSHDLVGDLDVHLSYVDMPQSFQGLYHAIFQLMGVTMPAKSGWSGNMNTMVVMSIWCDTVPLGTMRHFLRLYFVIKSTCG